MDNYEIDLLKRMVETPSVSGAEGPMAHMIQWELEHMGMTVEWMDVEPGRPIVLGYLKGKGPGPVLILNGHTDTHPVEHYQGDPWKVEICEGRLYGRGAVDMKGGLAAMICAVRRIALGGGLEHGTLILAAVPDEELLSQGTTYLVEYLERKGIRADAGIVGEPTGLKIGRFMRGVTHIDLTVKGYPQHTSGQNSGGNAIVQMARVISAMETELPVRYGQRQHPILGAPIYNIGMIGGGDKPNVVADTCMITLLRRDLPGENKEQVLKELEELARSMVSQGCSVEVQESSIQHRPGGRGRLPMEIPKDAKVVSVLEKALEHVLGEGPGSGMVPFWCDASIMTNEGKIPTVVFGPGDISCAHSPREWIELEQYKKAIDLYEWFLRNYAAS